MTTLIFNIILCTLVFQLDGRMLAGQMKRVSGGVGRNIADALGRFGHDVRFLTAVGDDSDGRSIIQSLEHIVRIYYYYNYNYYHRFVISCEIIYLCQLLAMLSRDRFRFVFVEHRQDLRGRRSVDVLVRGVPEQARRLHGVHWRHGMPQANNY